MFVTCFHEFRIYEFFSRIFSYLLLEQGRNLLLISKNIFKTFYFQKKRQFAATLKDNKKHLICNKKTRKFLDAGYLSTAQTAKKLWINS